MNRVQRYAEYSRRLGPLARFVLRNSHTHFREIRSHLSEKYVRGNGIEVGAGDYPMPLSPQSTVTYVDRVPREIYAKQYHLDPSYMVVPSVLCEADKLPFPDDSLDFVIANHVIEHLENPLSGLSDWLRVLKPNGILVLGVPNRRANEYDFERRPESIEHLAHCSSKLEHLREFVEIVDELPQGSHGFEERFRTYREEDRRIHFHVFDAQSVLELLTHVRTTLGIPVTLLRAFHFKYGFEMIFVLRKSHGSVKTRAWDGVRNATLLAHSSFLGWM